MKKHSILLVLILVLIFGFSSNSHAIEDKSIFIVLDKLDLEDVEGLFPENNIGIGFMNLKSREPYGEEGLYFSISLGRKVGSRSQYYKGLNKNKDGTIEIIGFEDMLKDLKKHNKNIKVDILGEKLKNEGISYIGDQSSAIIAADKYGNIKSGETNINYNNRWLEEKTKEHLLSSNILVLSYEVNEMENRLEILESYIDDFKDYNIMIIPSSVSDNMKHLLNKNLAPMVYSNRQDNGLIKSSSTKREGLVTIEDIYAELLCINNKKSDINIGNKINIMENEDNINKAKKIFEKNINLLWISYIFHGLVYMVQVYSAYYICKKRKDKFTRMNIFNNFIVINIFVSLLLGIFNLHLNIFLYLISNIIITYVITKNTSKKELNVIGLFSTLTYWVIVIGIIFYPKMVYDSYIGFNNLFYGARYYGFNNGIMGVLLVTSLISCFFIKDLIKNKSIGNLVCIFYPLINMLVLSSNYGANTGGFLTSVVLFLVIVYTNVLGKDLNIKNFSILVLIGILIFCANMYFDSMSSEKSHAINFLSRIKDFGIGEFIDMFKVKAKALIKLTILPPFIIVLISQVLSLKNLLKGKKISFANKAYIIIFIALFGFLINDTGMIFFIYMIHYLITLLVYNDIKIDSRN